MKRHNNIFILKSLFWHIQSRSVFTSTSFLEGNDLIKISNSSWGTKISGFHQNIISQKKAGLTTRLQWEFVATKNFISLGSLHPFVNLRWIHKGQDQPVKCAGRVPKLPGRFGKRTTKKNKILWSKCLHCIRKGWNIPSVWSHAAVDPDKLATTPSNTLTSNLDVWRVRLMLQTRKGGSAQTPHSTPAKTTNGNSSDGLQHILRALGPLSIRNGKEKWLLAEFSWHYKFVWGHLFPFFASSVPTEMRAQ